MTDPSPPPSVLEPGGTSDPMVQSHAASGPVFLIALVAGWAVMIIGFRSVLSQLPRPIDLGRWVLSGLVVHDAIWIPITVAVGLLTARVLPSWARAPVRAGLALSALLIVATLPVTRRWGALADNPSVDPANAGLGLAVILAVLWVAVAAWAVTQRHSMRRTAQ